MVVKSAGDEFAFGVSTVSFLFVGCCAFDFDSSGIGLGFASPCGTALFGGVICVALAVFDDG